VRDPLRLPRWGLLLLNLGTPDSTDPRDVRRYLREFLSDPRVFDISPVARWLLLNLVILPFRPRQSAEAYRKIWTSRGSPVLTHGLDLAERVAAALGADVPVELAMRYQSPSIASAFGRFREQGVDRIVVFPLFPQNSSAAWGSAVEKAFVEASRFWDIPALSVVPPFYDRPAFIEAQAEVARPVLADLRPERVLLSFHGLPERHVVKSDASGGRHCLRSDSCCDRIAWENRNCYRAQCFATARALAGRLGLEPGAWEVAFQSRLGGDPWIRPYTDARIQELARGGVRRLAVACPAFVADCLETLEEIAIRGRESFLAAGGEAFALIPCVNSGATWIQGVVQLAREVAPVSAISH
jgi:ferrochelatase